VPELFPGAVKAGIHHRGHREHGDSKGSRKQVTGTSLYAKKTAAEKAENKVKAIKITAEPAGPENLKSSLPNSSKPNRLDR
jgi:hypothetical protein